MRSRLLKQAIPTMCDASDFGLDDPATNLKKSAICIKYKVADLDELNPDATKYLCIKSRLPETEIIISLIDKESNKLVFYSKLEEDAANLVSSTPITQVSVWRLVSDLNTLGMPKKVFNFVLRHYGTIISDDIHTPAGKEFWKSRMIDADSEGYKVGILNTEEDSAEYSKGDIISWIQEKDVAWGFDKSHLRFFIKRSKLESY